MTKPLIQLDVASVRRAGRDLVSSVSWAVQSGEHWALVGGNGAGKSTLMKLARGDMPPTSGSRTYCFDGEQQFTPIGIRSRMALVSPELHEKYTGAGWRITGREAVLAGFFDSWLLYQEPTEAMIAAAERTFAELGLADLAGKLVGDMSTGELRKILLARAIASGPDVLFLDECMNGLDQPSRGAFMAALERAGTMATLVVAAHRLDEIPKCVERALLLGEGRVVACGGMQEIAAEYAGREVAERVAQPYVCELPQSGYDCLLKLQNGAHTMLGKPLLQGVDWIVRPGECWAVTGANGAGKSTLVKLVLGLVDPMPDTVLRWFDEPGLPDLVSVRRRVGLVSADLQVEYEYDLTVREVVWSGFFGAIGLYEEVTVAMKSRAAEAMDFFGLSELAHRPISQFSHGQLRRVLLARAVAPGPELLFLDEPTAGLDEPSRRLTLDLLQRLAEAGMPMVLITHHEDEMIPAVNRVLKLKDGKIA